MRIITSIFDLKSYIYQAKQEGQNIGLVPTMGYFHEGHLSLMRRSKQENDLTVVSLFVNPIQFGPTEDFKEYPRNFERDQEMASEAGVDVLFMPEASQMYPENFQTVVEVRNVSQGLCGSSRPGHFQGVATVVLKLFNLVEPDRAYFGEKDAQQIRVIRQMVRDLNLNVTVVGCPIVRENDGLAMSSRNIYLKPEERKAALVLFRVLNMAGQMITTGLTDAGQLEKEMIEIIDQEPLAQLDYLAIVDSDTLQPVSVLEGEVLLALAVKVGKTRLIDNCVVVAKGAV